MLNPPLIPLSVLAAVITNILGGVSLLAVVIFAVVAYIKKMGVRGKRLTVSAFVLGVVIAILIRLALLPASTFADWVFTSLFGLVAGLLATGSYKAAESAAGKTQPVTLKTYTAFVGEAQDIPADRLAKVADLIGK